MKHLSLIIASLLLSNAGWTQSLSFNIVGSIKGIERGDTLRFEKLLLPKWEQEAAFEVIVEQNDKFSYSGSHPHAQIYSMKYYPIAGKGMPRSEKTALPMFIDQGTVIVEGQRNQMYQSALKGGVYDDQILSSINALEDSLSIERSMLLNKIDSLRYANDTEGSSVAAEQFNNFRSSNAANFKRLNEMEKQYTDSAANEYVASELCQQSYIGLQKLDDGFQKLKPKAKESHYGKILYSIVEKLRSLEPGATAPEFRLTTIKGESVGLSDFKGKYLLIYHYGLCPGSMQAESYVTSFYEKNRDKVEVVGLTESMENLRQVASNTKEGDTIMGMDFKAIITSMTSHPWVHEAESTTDENGAISDIFNIQGLPFFICISPDGKIVSRGFFEAFQTAKKIVEEI